MNLSSNTYFDITDVVHFAMRENRVTGIQRVQTRIIGDFARLYPEKTHVTFQHPGSGAIVTTPAFGLFDAQEFDPIALLTFLGLLRWRRFPKKRNIIKRIKSSAPSRLRVLLEQAKVYALSLATPTKIQKSGIIPERPSAALEIRRLHKIHGGLTGENLVFLGTNWSFDALHTFARESKAKNTAVFQLIHDLIPIRYAEYCSESTQKNFISFLEASTHFTTHYLTVSNYTNQDLLKYLSTLSVLTKATTLRLAHEFGGSERVFPIHQETIPPSDTFVLFVGTLDRRKNIEGILAAWEILLERIPEKTPRLIFAGKPGWDSKEFMEKLHNSETLSKVVSLVDCPSDEQLNQLYKSCLFVLFPSIAEGWGLPVGEAAWLGKACLISPNTSLPEVCPESSIVLEDTSPQAIARSVETICAEDSVLLSISRRISSSPLRTWHDVANDLHRIIYE